MEKRLGVVLVLEVPAPDEVDERLPGITDEHSKDSEQRDDREENNSLREENTSSY